MVMRRILAAALCCVVGAAAAAAAAAAEDAPPRSVASGRFETPERPLWPGEIFELRLVWMVDWQKFGNLDGPLEWKADPLVAAAFGEPKLELNGPTARIMLSTRAMALAPGRLVLQPAQQKMVLQTAVHMAGDVPVAVSESKPVTGDAGTLTVVPLPAPPADFSGAVGRFTLSATAEPLRPKAGEAVVWRLTLEGEGNWPLIHGLPARLVSRDFDVVGKPRTTEGSGNTPFSGSLSEEVTLIPRVSGGQTLGPVSMSVFDPARGAYVTISAPAIRLDVAPGPGERPPVPKAERRKDQAGIPPALDGSEQTGTPLSPLAWRLGLIGPLLALVLAWAAIVVLRALRRDPGRPLRVAHARLRKILERLASSDRDEARRSLLRAWQAAFAARQKIDAAAPTPAAFVADDARALWVESEAYLYGPAKPLPQDWLARARGWMDRIGAPPAFPLRSLWRRDNLLPAVALFLLFAAAGPAVAADWKAEYRTARNLALRKRWEDAAAHAAVAWVQQPRAETAALWTMTARQAGYATARDGGVPLPPQGWEAFVAIQSAPGWQRVAVAAAVAGAAGAIVLLVALYAGPGRRWRGAGLGLLLSASIVGGISWLALDFYGPAGRHDGVILTHAAPARPLPVDTPEDDVPMLPAGMAGTSGDQFLGWTQVRFADGTDAWVRREHVRPVWRAGYSIKNGEVQK